MTIVALLVAAREGGREPMTERDFELGDVLSVTTGALVSRRHIDGVYDILGFMTGESLFTHQLPRASDECRPSLLEQHPDLAGVVVPEFHGETNDERRGSVFAWLDEMEARYGSTRPVAPLAGDDHTHIDPIAELGLRGVPPERIIEI